MTGDARGPLDVQLERRTDRHLSPEHRPEARAQILELERERRTRAERKSAIEIERERWTTRSGGAGQQIDALKARFTEAQTELEGMADLPARLVARRSKLLSALSAAERERQAAADSLSAAETAAKAAVQELRGGGGPHFIEVETYRFARHVGPGADLNLQYRSEQEVETWRQRDQIARLAQLLPEADRKRVDAEVEREIAGAFNFAEASPFPGDNELFTHVFHD